MMQSMNPREIKSETKTVVIPNRYVLQVGKTQVAVPEDRLYGDLVKLFQEGRYESQLSFDAHDGNALTGTLVVKEGRKERRYEIRTKVEDGVVKGLVDYQEAVRPIP